MSKTKQISGNNIALLFGRNFLPVVRLHSLSYRPDIGFSDTANPALINRVQNKSRGIQQSNLFSVSAGNVLRMTTMRPNPYLSAGIEMRRSYRGLLQLNSQAN